MKARDSLTSAVHSKLSKKTSSLKSRATKSLLVNLEDFGEPFVVVPPDGGWGWVIVSVSVLSLFTVDGVGYCFGIFLHDISKDLNCDITEVALASSILGGFYYLSGPFTCAAINRYGFRTIGVVGGLISSAAFLASSFMPTIKPFIIIIGICGGTGFNFIYTASVIAVSFYFEKWRVLAMAISCCGSSLGLIGFPPIMTILLENFHWRRKFQLIALLFGLCGFLGLTYKPLRSRKVERTVQFGEVSKLPSVSTLERETELASGGLAGFFQRFKNAFFPTISETSIFTNHLSTGTTVRYASKTSYEMFMNQRRDIETISTYLDVENYPIEFDDSDEETTHFRGCCKCCKDSVERKCCSCCLRFFCCRRLSTSRINRPMYRDDIFYTGSVYHLSQYSKRGSQISGATHRIVPSLAYTMSVSRAATQRDLLQENRCVCCPDACLRTLATLLHFQMLKSPTFILLLISGFLSLVGTYTCLIYVQQRAFEIGIDENVAVMLLSIIGMANTVGRIMCGFVSCFPYLDINLITWITLLLCGCVTVASIYLTTNFGQIIFCSVFGVTIATFAVLRTVVFVEFFGLENLTNCFGLNMVFQSMAAFCGVPIINLLYGSFKSFNFCFIFTGVVIIVSAILLIPLRCILKWEQKKS